VALVQRAQRGTCLVADAKGSSLQPPSSRVLLGSKGSTGQSRPPSLVSIRHNSVKQVHHVKEMCQPLPGYCLIITPWWTPNSLLLLLLLSLHTQWHHIKHNVGHHTSKRQTRSRPKA